MIHCFESTATLNPGARLRQHSWKGVLQIALFLTAMQVVTAESLPGENLTSASVAPTPRGIVIDPAMGVLPDQQIILSNSNHLKIDNPSVTQEVLGRSGRSWVVRLRYPADCEPFQFQSVSGTVPLLDQNVVQPGQLPPASLFRLAVANTAVYRITYQELLAAGLEPGELNDPDRIALFANGQPQPLRVTGDEDGVFNSGDAVEFWGEAPLNQNTNSGSDLYHDPWSPWNIYYLYESDTAPQRMIEESGEIVSVTPGSYFPVTYFTTTHRFENDNYFDRLVVENSQLELDHFFFDDGTRAGEASEYQFALPGIWTGISHPVDIVVGLRGQSFSTPENPDAGIHRAQILMNNELVLVAGTQIDSVYSWQDQEFIEVSTGPSDPFPSSNLAEENILLLLVDGLPLAGENNRVLLDYFSVTCQRDLVARGDQMLLTLDPADGIPAGVLLDIVIQGFSSNDILIYRDDGAMLTNAEIRPTGANSYRCHFQDVIEGPVQYRVITSEQLQPAVRIDRVDPLTAFGLTPATCGSDYLVILPDSLLTAGISDSLQLWLDNHPGEFNSYNILPSSQVYDWFSNGRHSPYAIRDLLAYGLHYWDQFPRYLLLAGDGSDNARGDLAAGQPLLPVKYRFAHNWGATATEHWFGQLTEDLFPDVIVGRLPAASADDLSSILKKLISYQDAVGGRWQNRLLFVTGIGGVGNLTFSDQITTLVQNWVPQRYFVERLLTDDIFSPFFGGTEQLLQYLDQGTVLVNYTGHGGGAIWSDNNLFRDEDVRRLQNGQTLPFITNFTCYINAFESGRTLGEELLVAPEQGAIGTLGCSSLSFFLTGNEFAQYFNHNLLTQPQQPVGEALFQGTSTFLSLYADDIEIQNEHGLIVTSLLNSLNILGDPAQQLYLPQPLAAPALTPAVGMPGAALTGEWETQSDNQDGLLRFYNRPSWPLLRGASPLYHVAEDALQLAGDGVFTLASAFPDSCPGGSPGQVRLLSWSDDPATAVSAQAPFFYADSLAVPYLWGTGTVPAEVASNTLFHFVANCAAATTISELSLELTVLDSLDITFAEYSEVLTIDPDQPTRFTGTSEYGTFPSGYKLGYYFITEDAAGTVDTTTTSWQEVVPLISDPLLGNIYSSPAAGGGLRLTVANQGNNAVENLPLRLSLSSDSTSWSIASTSVLERIDAGRDTMITLNLPVIDYRWLLFELDPDSVIADADRDNNSRVLSAVTRYYSVNSELGTHDGTQHAVIHLDPQTSLEILPGEIPPAVEGVLEVSLLEKELQQPGLATALPFYQVKPVGLLTDVPIHWGWLIPADSSDVPTLTLVDRWQSEWLRCEPVEMESDGDTLRLQATVDMICGAVPGFAIDSEQPRLDISVEDQILTSGGFVSRRPTFTIHASDVNGIDVELEQLTAHVNDVPLASSEIHFDPAGEMSSVGLALKPDLSMLSPDSIHVITVGMQDLCGNRDSVLTLFRIATSLTIEYYGNYPNPFEDETLFIFNLTDLTDRVELDIFTTAGRRIRRLSQQGPLINYTEIHWDGRDEEYRAVANGVYFYRITAWQGDNKVSSTGKAARLR